MNVRTFRPTLLAAAMAVGLALPAYAQDGMGDAPGGPPLPQSDQPATRPATTQGAREMGAIMGDLQQVQTELAQTMNNPSVLSDPEVRDKTAEKAVPVLKRLVGLMAEAAAAAPQPQMAEQLRAGSYQVQAILVGFGDEETEARLKAEGEVVEAKAALLLGRFIAANDQAEKLAIVKELDQLATENPESQAVAQSTMGIIGLAEQDEQISAAAKAIVNEKLEGPAAEQMKQMLQQMEQAQQEEKDFLAKFMDKPLTVEGQSLSGGTASTEQFKGKVVMVDFWATWCPPCIAALPKIKEDYKQYHDQGFEILAVSLDQSAEPLKQFLTQNPEMTWPQIYTEGNPKASSEIAKKLGIQAIPTVFLLDRKGNVRAMAIGGGAQMDKLHKMIPELLKEPA